MSRMWCYTLAVLVLWVVNPEIRRLYDWRVGYSNLEILSLLPLVSIVPHMWSLTLGGGWKRLPRVIALAGWIWLGGFTYALIVAAVLGNLVPGTYTFITYVFPVAVGLWVAADDAPFVIAYRRISRLLFSLTTLISIYAIIQYAVAPAWDVLWLQSVIADGSTSFGKPLPFQIRVFSTLNSPGTFSVFLTIALLLALPQLSLRKPALLAQMPIWLVAFGLALVRSSWLMFAVGALVYLLLTPRRATFLATCGLAALLFSGVIVVLPEAVGNDTVISSLSNRLATLTDLDNDASAKNRSTQPAAASQLIADAPFGLGLGVLGTSNKLRGKDALWEYFDSGLLGRAVEMGIPGFLLYAAPFVLLFAAAFGVWNYGHVIGDMDIRSLAAMSIGLSIAFAWEQMAGEASGITSLLVWLILCLTARGQPISLTRDRPLDQHREFALG